MKDIFICLLLNLAHHGKITEANMYKCGTYSNITIKGKDGIYRISVTKETEQEIEKEKSNE